jgi:hypothetical protein
VDEINQVQLYVDEISWLQLYVGVPVAECFKRHRSHTTRSLTSVGLHPAHTDVTVRESLSVHLQKVSGLFPNALYNVCGFSLPPIKTDRHHITEKLLSMVKMTNKTVVCG